MANHQIQIELDNFDDIWGLYGEPVLVEKKLLELLPQAEALNDKSIYLQILSQIALAQALQKRFDEAHKTLDLAELFSDKYDLAQVRILLERGRVFHQAGNIPEAKLFFEKSFKLSTEKGFDFHTINAAHMIAIVVDKIEDKIQWNQRALEMTQRTKDGRARRWLGSLYNNLGQNYLDVKQFDKALTVYQQALEFFREEDYQPNIRVAEWAVGRTLRNLGRQDEALNIQTEVLKKYHSVAESGKLDCPAEMFTQLRGYVHQELAEIHEAKAKQFAQLALADLADNEVVKTFEKDKLERLKNIQEK
jgi:tetratricopeptide (TPR) repeat protein